MSDAAENGTALPEELAVPNGTAENGAASPSRWVQSDGAAPDIGDARDISRLGESVVKVRVGWAGDCPGNFVGWLSSHAKLSLGDGYNSATSRGPDGQLPVGYYGYPTRNLVSLCE